MSAVSQVFSIVLGSNVVYALPDARGVTLIDAGPDFDGSWEIAVHDLARLGARPADVHTVVLTHAHLDHAGLAARWQAEGATILVGEGDAAALAMTDDERLAERVLARAYLLDCGVPEVMLNARGAGGERYTRWPAPLRMTPVHDAGLLRDGATLDVGGRMLQALARPGHTPGTVLLKDSVTDAVFTGDHILPRMAASVGIQFEGRERRAALPLFMKSLAATRDIPASTVYPGHGDMMADLPAAVDWTVRFLEQRARRLLSRLRERPATPFDVAARMFPHLGARGVRPVMAETVGLLDLLAERGLATQIDDGPPIVWAAAGR